MKRFLLVLLGFLYSGIASADQAVIYPFKGSFDDATFNVESAILDKGLVIDHVSHTGEMLARTGADLRRYVVRCGILFAADRVGYRGGRLGRCG